MTSTSTGPTTMILAAESMTMPSRHMKRTRTSAN
eukprot:CAMPEP_0184436656 /NCGR_PEP_ID=MMETSP0738-20130409/552447_1 /TAXON_ID=385413 /ORGANISM="Thalassiosira miniscula, Strain CCMP1093" /LENGTH=33 /DNA_ID= /DNA_START= /DNA_END= /DNA_ORIENTATION=